MHLPVVKYLYENGGYERNSADIETNNLEVDETWTENPWDRILRIEWYSYFIDYCCLMSEYEKMHVF